MPLSKLRAVENVKAIKGGNLYIAQLINSLKLDFFNEDWQKWYDGLGYYISVNKNSNSVRYKEPETLVFKDIHFLMDINNVLKVSTAVLFSIDSGIQLWLLGIDGVVRYISYSEGKWNKQEPPLSKGLVPLRILFNNTDCPTFVEIGDIEGYKNVWFSQLPFGKRLQNKLSKTEFGEILLKELNG